MLFSTLRVLALGHRHFRVVWNILLAAVLIWWSAGNCLAQSLSDEIFNSGVESGITLKGKAGYPGPLASATIELHLGSYVATTLTGADGSYKLFVEQSHISAPAIAEIFAFGHGADSTRVWAGNLGPTDRLLTLVNAGSISFPDEPFLNLNPRSTSIAAALRAYNGFAPVADKTTFYKAARSYQVQTQDIAYGLALIARGDQALPPGAVNTFDAVRTLANLQKVFADEQALAQVSGCTFAPPEPFCDVRSTLPLDPTIVPTHPWVDGRIYAGIVGFDFTLDTPTAFRAAGATMDVIGFGGGNTPITANVVFESDGSETLTRSGGQAFGADVTFPVINGNQVEQDDTIYTIHLRTVLGPGGQLEGHGSPVHTYTYPGHPEIMSYTASDPWDMPGYLGGDPLPPELVALIPDVTNGAFLLASPFASADPSGPFGYDVYNFSTTSGTAERTAKGFTFSGAATTQLSLDFAADSIVVDVQFIDEEMPGILRVRMHAVGPSSDRVFDGLFMKTTGAAGGFTAANTPGVYDADLNGYACGGPYGELEAFCTPPLEWTFVNDGTVNRSGFGSSWGAWQLATGADAGRLLLARPSFVAAPVTQRRAWEVVRATGPNDIWILENVTNSPGGAIQAPPIVFNPTSRLTHLTTF